MNRFIASYQIACAIILGLFMAAAAYCYPQVDDYIYGLRPLNMGWVNSQIAEYTNWNGRFVATGLVTAGPLTWGSLWAYRLLPVVLIGLYFLSFLFLLHSWSRFTGDKKAKLFWALSLTTLSILAMPSISQGLYWFASSYTYTTSAIFANFAAGLLLRTQRSASVLMGAGIFSVLVVGSNETAMILWLYVLMGFIAYIFHTTKKIDKGVVFVFAVSIAAAAVVALAPGNALRASQFEGNHRFFFTLGNMISYSFIFPIRFLTISIVTFCLAFASRLVSDWKTEDLRKDRYWILLFWAGIIFVSFLPSLWAMGRKPNARTLNLIFHFYVVGFFLVIPLYFNLAKLQTILFKDKSRQWAMGVLALLGLLVSKPTRDLAKGFAGDFQAYEENWKKIIAGDYSNRLTADQRAPTLYFKDTDEYEKHFDLYLQARPEFFK